MLRLAIIPFPIGELGPFTVFPAILAEVLACYLLQRRAAPFSLVFIGVVCANVATLAVGYILLGLTAHATALPRGLSPASLVLSWVLSVALQYGVYTRVKLGRDLPRLLLTVAVSNLAGYSLLGLLLWRFGL